jgi:hypothetical protein
VTIENCMDGAFSWNSDVPIQPPDQQFAEIRGENAENDGRTRVLRVSRLSWWSGFRRFESNEALCDVLEDRCLFRVGKLQPRSQHPSAGDPAPATANQELLARGDATNGRYDIKDAGRPCGFGRGEPSMPITVRYHLVTPFARPPVGRTGWRTSSLMASWML